MVKNKLFLRWWLLATLIAVTSGFCYKLGLFYDVWLNDNSYLSFVILALFYGMTMACGYQTYVVSKFVNRDKNYTAYDKQEMLRQEQTGWFSSDQCLTIGMIGTVWGFIMMLKGFGGFKGDASSVQKLMDYIVAGMATALYTTFVGLICGMLLKLQYFNLTHVIENTPLEDLTKMAPKKKCCGGGKCKPAAAKEGDLSPYYSYQFIQNEVTDVNPGASVESEFHLEHYPVLKGSVTGSIFRDGICVQTFELKEKELLSQLVGDDVTHYVEGMILNPAAGILQLTWSKNNPGDHHLIVSYEYEMRI
jgi:hypothetical protein